VVVTVACYIVTLGMYNTCLQDPDNMILFFLIVVNLLSCVSRITYLYIFYCTSQMHRYRGALLDFFEKYAK
jgi:hypothetical protein